MRRSSAWRACGLITRIGASPEIAETVTGYTLIANDLAHPLAIHSQKRIENDYELDDTYKIDIITGSNMAGKSTFLRTIGINTVKLALCGAPGLRKQSMSVSVMTIISYMRDQRFVETKAHADL